MLQPDRGIQDNISPINNTLQSVKKTPSKTADGIMLSSLISGTCTKNDLCKFKVPNTFWHYLR